MMDALQSFFYGIPYYLITLGVLIAVHEYGHYRVAVACNIKVFRFSLGFGRVLWRRNFGKDNAEFALSAIPLGGYVSMLEKTDADTPPEDIPRALENRPLWQRMAVILAGPAANLLLGVVLYTAAQFVGIEQLVPALSEPSPGSLLATAGLRSGDRVLALRDAPADDAGQPDDASGWQDVRSFDDLFEGIAVAMMDQHALTLRVRRPNETGTHDLALPLDALGKTELDADSFKRIGLTAPYAPPLLSDIVHNGQGMKQGLRTGDLVEAIDGVPVPDAQALRDRIRASAADGNARPMQWTLRRDGQELSLPVTARVVTEEGKHYGRIDSAIGGQFAQELVHDGLIDSMRYGAVQTWHRAALSLRLFGRMLTGRTSVKNLSGPISIADAAGKSASRGLADFLAFLARVSVGIGVLNLLPIPVLDGGRRLYYLFEGAAGRPVSTPWQNWLRYGGVLAILLLMSIALSNDVARFLGLQ
jgi:regulator of sigma E protease